MGRLEIPAAYTVIHMWEAFAKEMLAQDESLYGRYKHRVPNAVIYRDKINGTRVEVATYKKFRRIVEHFFEQAKNAIIEGKGVRLPQCGTFVAMRIERDFRRKKRNRSVNWAATQQRPKVWNERLQKMTADKLVYFTSDEYCRIGWLRNLIENRSFYEFEPANGNMTTGKGFKKEFTTALMANPLLKLKYFYCPKE